MPDQTSHARPCVRRLQNKPSVVSTGGGCCLLNATNLFGVFFWLILVVGGPCQRSEM